MVSPPLTSFSSFFSRFRSLIVPRFLREYTLLARFLIDGDALSVCCIIRTHSSMSMSLVKPTPISQNPTSRDIDLRVPVIVQPNCDDITVFWFCRFSSGSPSPPLQRRSSLVRTRTTSQQLFFTGFEKDPYL